MTSTIDTYQKRLRKYHRRERLITWIGAGYVALIAMMTTKAFEKAGAPQVLDALLITLIGIGGYCLGRARVGFEWLATLIDRQIEDGDVKLENQMPVTDVWPKNLDRYWFASIYMISAAGVVVLIIVWWDPIKTLMLCSS